MLTLLNFYFQREDVSPAMGGGDWDGQEPKNPETEKRICFQAEEDERGSHSTAGEKDSVRVDFVLKLYILFIVWLLSLSLVLKSVQKSNILLTTFFC